MNIKKLKAAEENFLGRYPGGLGDPEIEAIAKKHKMEKMTELTREYFAKKNFEDPYLIVENFAKMITKSSMVSVFEKVKFRNAFPDFDPGDRVVLAQGLKDLFHGNQKKGFGNVVSVLQKYDLAKWPIVTSVLTYFEPEKEVFIKPTTAKGVIEYFEIEGIKYSPKPTWEFYEKYRTVINEMKKLTGGKITGNNAGFCGFLMMSLNFA